MARAVSVRLDDEAERALGVLERRSGLRRSDAIRQAIVDAAAAAQRHEALASEAAALLAADDDRAEMAEVASLMESLRAEG